MRIDKFLKNSRIIKRRQVAKKACEDGRITINEKEAKPGTIVEEGDIIRVSFGNNTLKVKVNSLLDTSRKTDASSMYEVIDE